MSTQHEIVTIRLYENKIKLKEWISHKDSWCIAFMINNITPVLYIN